MCNDKVVVIGVKEGLTFKIRPFAPALKLPAKRHTLTVKQLQKVKY